MHVTKSTRSIYAHTTATTDLLLCYCVDYSLVMNVHTEGWNIEAGGVGGGG